MPDDGEVDDACKNWSALFHTIKLSARVRRSVTVLSAVYRGILRVAAASYSLLEELNRDDQHVHRHNQTS